MYVIRREFCLLWSEVLHFVEVDFLWTMGMFQ
jgi:hypothetical protein